MQMNEESKVRGYKLKRTNLDEIAKQDKLSRNAIKLFFWLGDRITEGSRCMVDTKDIGSYLSIDKSRVSNVVSELEDGLLIKVERKNGSMRVIEVCPTYYWLGDYSLQQGAIRRWYNEIREKHWGSIIKDTEVFLQTRSQQSESSIDPAS
jgi:hypothetical protein